MRTYVIPLGVDTDIYRPRDKCDARFLLGLPQHHTILLCFGRIDHTSKADLGPLLITLNRLAGNHKDLTLVIAGVATDQAIAQLHWLMTAYDCKVPVIIRRQPSKVEAPLYYSACDIFVGLSDTLQESFGLTPLEAMASCVPVVVADWSGYRETVMHGTTGFRVTTRWAPCDARLTLMSPLMQWQSDHLLVGQSVAIDPEELYSYLDELISRPELRAAMGSHARNHIMQQFAWTDIVSRYQDLWSELRTIGLAIPRSPIGRDGIRQARYYDNFGHYATKRLDGSECLELTEYGKIISKHPDAIKLYDEVRLIIHAISLVTILRYVRLVTSQHSKVTVGRIASIVISKYHVSRDDVLIHVMWLLKYGMLRLQS